jgi:hypothetical protein
MIATTERLPFQMTTGGASVVPKPRAKTSATAKLRFARRRSRQAKSMLASLAVVWAICTFAATLVLDANVALRFPYLADLSADYAKQTGPVVVALGSSRTEGSFEINRMTAYLARNFPDRRMTAFSAAVPASGLFTQEAVLKELLAVGPTPEVVIVEVNPEFLNHCNVWLKIPRDLTWSNVLDAGTDVFQKSGARFLENRFLPLFSRRFEVRLAAWRWMHSQFGLTAPKLDPKEPRVPTLWSNFVPTTPPPTPMTDEIRARQMRFKPPALVNFSATGSAAKALERILKTCQERDIPVVMVDAPLCSLSRRQLAPAKEKYAAYINALLERYPKARYYDASAAIPDAAFGDHHHVNPYGQHLMCSHLAQVLLPEVFASWNRTPISNDMARSNAESVMK